MKNIEAKTNLRIVELEAKVNSYTNNTNQDSNRIYSKTLSNKNRMLLNTSQTQIPINIIMTDYSTNCHNYLNFNSGKIKKKANSISKTSHDDRPLFEMRSSKDKSNSHLKLKTNLSTQFFKPLKTCLENIQYMNVNKNQNTTQNIP